MNWLLGLAAVAVVGPVVLRKMAENPEALRASAGAIERARAQGIALGRRGAEAAAAAAKRYAKSKGLGATPAEHARMAVSTISELDTWTGLAETTLSSRLDRSTRCAAASATLDSAFTTFGQLSVHAKPQADARRLRLAMAANNFRDSCVAGGSGRMPHSSGGFPGSGPYYTY